MSAPQLTLDAIGTAYIAIAVVWTSLLVGGMAFLHHHRKLPALQQRRLPLLFVGIVSLHIYWIACMLGYVIGAFVPCTAEFWIMSLYLPFGIAIFQVANTQFLDVATRQRKFAHGETPSRAPSIMEKRKGLRGVVGKVRSSDNVTKLTVLIGLGLIVQLALTLFVFFGSKKFHPGYGLFDVTLVGTTAEKRFQCAKGWEWWLSIVWQFFWSWLYAPYILWKSRNIHDVNGWRTQTIGCCLAGLFASPMWLAGLYIPQMAAVNKYFIPPNWISLSISLFEVFTVALPCYQVLKSKALTQETLEAIAAWEARNKEAGGDGSFDTGASTVTKVGTQRFSLFKSTARSTVSKTSSTDSRKSDMYTMSALENALRTNSDPLLQFAALRDFSGENIAFITHLAKWKQAWLLRPDGLETDPQLRRAQFYRAVRLYSTLISLDYSEFPINISSKCFKVLEDMFGEAAAQLNRRQSIQSDSATPFDQWEVPPSPTGSSSTTFSKGGMTTELSALGAANLNSASTVNVLDGDDAGVELTIPVAFSPSVFEPAEQEIKYLVLTNTWPKFVNAGYANYEESAKKPGVFSRAMRIFHPGAQMV